MTFLRGNLCPDGAVVKSTAIDPKLLDIDGVFRQTGPARVLCDEKSAIAAIKSSGDDRIQPGDVIVLTGVGPVAAGMPETAQITVALRYLSFGSSISLITDGRFSGFSSGPCIGHISPEGICGGPIGRLRDGDLIEIVIDTKNGVGTLECNAEWSTRSIHSDLQQHELLPDDTRLWAALQQVSGGSWGGCVYDVDAIVERLKPDN